MRLLGEFNDRNWSRTLVTRPVMLKAIAYLTQYYLR